MIIPTRFLQGQIPLSWADVRWAYIRQIIGWTFPVAVAKARVDAGARDDLDSEMAGVGKDRAWRVGELLDEISGAETAGGERSARKWLYLTMLWLYENRDRVADPFEALGEVYADFGYPDEIRHFVAFMPPEDGYDPLEHTEVENRARIVAMWKAYLERSAEQLCRGPNTLWPEGHREDS